MIWDKFRSQFCPQRIYRYGKVGLFVYDDRTRIEQICDYVDEWLFNYRQRQREKRATRRQAFHSFFDVSTGQRITSVAQIEDIKKKKGLEFMSFRELDSEAKRYKKINEQDAKRTIKKDMSNIFHEVRQGKKFVTEIKKKISQGHYEIGKKKAFNQ